MRIRGLEMLVFRKILHTFLMDDLQVNSSMSLKISQIEFNEYLYSISLRLSEEVAGGVLL